MTGFFVLLMLYICKVPVLFFLKNIRGLNLVVKLTTVQVTKLPL
jgi:hypothetical protein